MNQREQTTAQVKLNWINAEINLQEATALARFFLPRNNNGYQLETQLINSLLTHRRGKR